MYWPYLSTPTSRGNGRMDKIKGRLNVSRGNGRMTKINEAKRKAIKNKMVRALINIGDKLCGE